MCAPIRVTRISRPVLFRSFDDARSTDQGRHDRQECSPRRVGPKGSPHRQDRLQVRVMARSRADRGFTESSNALPALRYYLASCPTTTASCLSLSRRACKRSPSTARSPPVASWRCDKKGGRAEGVEGGLGCGGHGRWRGRGLGCGGASKRVWKRVGGLG